MFKILTYKEALDKIKPHVVNNKGLSFLYNDLHITELIIWFLYHTAHLNPQSLEVIAHALGTPGAHLWLYHRHPEIQFLEAATALDSIIIQELVKQGVNINARDRLNYSSALHLVIDKLGPAITLFSSSALMFSKRSEEVIRMLIALGADINAKDRYGTTALHSAAYYGLNNIIEMLIATGAKVDENDNQGITPLMLAVEKGHKTIVEMLLDADTTITCQNGETALKSG